MRALIGRKQCLYQSTHKHGNLLLTNTRALYVDYFNKTRLTMSLFSDLNTWDVGKTLEKVENIPRVYIREQRHGKHVLLLN